MHRINADLHCHPMFRMAPCRPRPWRHRAHANGVQLWSLTDHDEVGGQHRAHKAAAQLGMAYLAGSEISVTFAQKTVHIVGLGFDPDEPQLLQGLADTRNGRERRARDMAADLARVGIPNTFEGALKYVGNPDLISRTHFARYMVEIGVLRPHEVFKST